MKERQHAINLRNGQLPSLPWVTHFTAADPIDQDKLRN